MADTLLLVTSTMSHDRQRVRQIKFHINQLLSELRVIESNVDLSPLQITINSQLTNLSHDEHFCPCLPASKRRSSRLHSTANNAHRKKSSKCPSKLSPMRFLFAASARATSTPKASPDQRRLTLQPHQTSTPRRAQRHSTALALSPTSNIPLKRLLYNHHDQRAGNRRHSAVPCSKRSILPRLHRIDEHPQWI